MLCSLLHDLSICADIFSQDQVTEPTNPTTISFTTDPSTTEPVTPTTEQVTPTTEPMTTSTPTTNPSETCGGPGWRRVAYINMIDPNQDCPQGLSLTDYSIRSCGRTHTGHNSCSQSVMFPIDGPQYSQVCGRVTAYRWGQNYAFLGYHIRGQTTVDGGYVDGLSFTHGSPRTHIWTFASGLFNGTSGDSSPNHRCPCDPGNTISSPPFVGNDYFCESVTIASLTGLPYRLYPDNYAL